MSAAIQQAKESARLGRGALLETFAHVPDDRLTWSPSPTAKSALAIAAHAGVSNHGLAGLLQGAGLPGTTFQDVMAESERAERRITTREQAVAVIEESTEAVLAALDRLTPEQIQSTVELPFITAPMTFFMNLPGLHMNNHAAQIDYLQTIWGDLEFHR